MELSHRNALPRRSDETSGRMVFYPSNPLVVISNTLYRRVTVTKHQKHMVHPTVEHRYAYRQGTNTHWNILIHKRNRRRYSAEKSLAPGQALSHCKHSIPDLGDKLHSFSIYSHTWRDYFKKKNTLNWPRKCSVHWCLYQWYSTKYHTSITWDRDKKICMDSQLHHTS